MRLIDADALIEAMSRFSNAMGEDMTHALFYTNIAPTVEAEPVRHGKWIRTGLTNIYGGTVIECDRCHDRVVTSPIAIKNERYCRNCGAKMDEAERKEE